MAKVLRTYVHVTKSDNSVVILAAGDTVPEDLAEYVTNPKAFVELDLEREEQDEQESGEESYEDLTIDELKDKLKGRELPVSGNKPDLIERLQFDDLEREEQDEQE